MNSLSLIVFLFDLVVVGLTWAGAHWIRFGFTIPAEFIQTATANLIWLLPTYALILWRSGLYRGLWRFASLSDLQRIVLTLLGAATVVAAVVAVGGISQIPRSVLIMHPVLALLVMGGARFFYRSWKEHRLIGWKRWSGTPLLVLGSGEEVAGLLRELRKSRDWYAVGILDPDRSRIGRRLHAVPIIGHLSEVGELARRLNVQHVLVAMPSAKAETRRRATEAAVAAGLTVMTVPAFEDLLSGRVTISNLRKIELEDLLGRDPVALDTEGLEEFIGGQVVMVTGGGGSIGSELCRQISRFKPSLLVLFELSEYALYQVEQEFANRFPMVQVVCLVGDVKDKARVDDVMARFQPAIVFHAAAYKHVPLMENENVWQTVRNNVLGTLVLARSAAAAQVKCFVLISTDKAVNPTSVMGASKRMAEMICQALQGETPTRFVTVRFGNVLGSTGSVIPKFREQIARGGPVTVTHPAMTRYFMLIPEAAQLVLQAACMGKGGEIFVLEMGEPVKIVDLARDMIRLSGMSERDIPISFTGLRPGEKLYEELLADSERTLPTSHQKVRMARAREVSRDCLEQLESWLSRPGTFDDMEIRLDMQTWIPEYMPTLGTSRTLQSAPGGMAPQAAQDIQAPQVQEG